MSNTLRTLRIPAILSLALVLPFMVLEVINRRSYHEGFPIALFALLWLLPLSFILVALPITRSPAGGAGTLAQRLGILLRVALLVLIAWLWGSLVLDQLPCFLGVPNCD